MKENKAAVNLLKGIMSEVEDMGTDGESLLGILQAVTAAVLVNREDKLFASMIPHLKSELELVQKHPCP